MLFNTVRFFIFLFVVLVLFYGAPKPFRKWILLAASYYFYMSWIPKYIFVLLSLTVIDYTSAIWIERAGAGARKKFLLIVSLCANLGFLGFFKYYNFIAENIAHLAGRPDTAFTLKIILPLGISFHTFQSMSYVIDVYRGEQPAVRNPIDYALYISFFPQLVAGPIVRARDFFRDLYDWHAPSGDDVQYGAALIVLGLVKKMVFADQFALIADAYFKNVAATPGRMAAWTAVVSFAIQIFFDFSGYTDIAIGTAKLFGYHFPVNFRRPYLASSITDFWRRWHISLSTWLRDYLYIPLGGNRHGALNTYRNLMLTMLLGGLWHGASWNFVIWGGYHGALLAVEKMMGKQEMPAAVRRLLYPFRAVFTFFLVCIGWVFFRAQTFADARYVLGQMFTGPMGTLAVPRWLIVLVLLALILALMEEHFDYFERLPRAPALTYATSLVLMLLTLEMFSVTDVSIPFVYFQF